MKINKKELKNIILEEAKKIKHLKFLKEEKAKIEKQLKEFDEMDDFDEIPDSWKEFDEFEFNTSAKDAAMQDIKNDPTAGDFSDIGDNEFEKDMTAKDFAAPINAANLKLPNQEKQLQNIQKKLDFEKKYGTIHVNEDKKK